MIDVRDIGGASAGQSPDITTKPPAIRRRHFLVGYRTTLMLGLMIYLNAPFPYGAAVPCASLLTTSSVPFRTAMLVPLLDSEPPRAFVRVSLNPTPEIEAVASPAAASRSRWWRDLCSMRWRSD